MSSRSPVQFDTSPSGLQTTSAAALAGEIVRLMRDFSVELAPAELARRASCPAGLPAGSRVCGPWIAGARFEQTLRAVVRVRELGLVPVPHLAVRAIADAAALQRMLAELWREAAVDHALLIAGSQAVPVGTIDNTVHALATGLFERHGMRSLGLAAHPEGSPDIGADAFADASMGAPAKQNCVTRCPHWRSPCARRMPPPARADAAGRPPAQTGLGRAPG